MCNKSTSFDGSDVSLDLIAIWMTRRELRKQFFPVRFCSPEVENGRELVVRHRKRRLG